MFLRDEIFYRAKSNANLTIWQVQMSFLTSEASFELKKQILTSSKQILTVTKFSVRSCFQLVRNCMNYGTRSPASWTMWSYCGTKFFQKLELIYIQFRTVFRVVLSQVFLWSSSKLASIFGLITSVFLVYVWATLCEMQILL